MNCFCDTKYLALDVAFKNFELTIEKKSNYVIVKGSVNLAKEKIIDIVKSAGFCPLVSENRFFGDFVFTVCPFKPPAFFEYVDYKDLSLSPIEEVWQSIKEESDDWRGRKETIDLSGHSPIQRKVYWGAIFNQTSLQPAPPLLHEFLLNQPKEQVGKVALDVGCGQGTSSLELLKKRWRVIAVDYSSEAVGFLRERANRMNKEWIEVRQLLPFDKDIEEFDFDNIRGRVDLIVANDSLSYFDPLKFREIWMKMHAALKEGGYLIGSFYYTVENEFLRETFRETGLWSMRGGLQDVHSLLVHSHYEVKQCRYRTDDLSAMNAWVEFTAQKLPASL